MGGPAHRIRHPTPAGDVSAIPPGRKMGAARGSERREPPYPSRLTQARDGPLEDPHRWLLKLESGGRAPVTEKNGCASHVPFVTASAHGSRIREDLMGRPALAAVHTVKRRRLGMFEHRGTWSGLCSQKRKFVADGFPLDKMVSSWRSPWPSSSLPLFGSLHCVDLRPSLSCLCSVSSRMPQRQRRLDARTSEALPFASPVSGAIRRPPWPAVEVRHHVSQRSESLH